MQSNYDAVNVWNVLSV